MSSTYLIVILFICAIAVVVLQFTPQISILTKKEFIDKLWFKLTVAVLIAVIALCANLIKEHNSDIKHDLKEKELVKFYSNRNDSTNRSNTLTYIDELAKYGLHYDSAEKRIEKLVKDSLNNEIPDFGVISNKDAIQAHFINKDSITGQIELENKGNCPINLILDLYIIPYTEGEFQIPMKFATHRNEVVNIKEPLVDYFGTFISQNIKPTYFYFFLKGKYSTLNNKISNPLNLICRYDFEDNAWGIPRIPEVTKVRNFLKDNGIK